MRVTTDEGCQLGFTERFEPSNLFKIHLLFEIGLAATAALALRHLPRTIS